MIGRRDLLHRVAFGAVALSAQSVSACSSVVVEPDQWGQRLIAFFRSGQPSELDGLFQNFSTLVSFSASFIESNTALEFSGAGKVAEALQSLRRYLTKDVGNGPRGLVNAKIVGNQQQGVMARIELQFADRQVIDTSCGPTRDEVRADIYYQAGVYETGDDKVKWAVERIAILPALETRKQNG